MLKLFKRSCKMENQKLQPFNNLTKGERKALQELTEKYDIVIAKADKCGEVVIIDVKNCIREIESQLKNRNNYDRLKYDPIETHKRLVNDTIERFKKQKMMKKKSCRRIKGRKREYNKFLFTTINI